MTTATEAGRTPPRARASGSSHRVGGYVLATAVPVALFGLWWWASTWAKPLEVPSPALVLAATADLLWGPEAYHTWTSMARIVIAVILSLVIGGVLVSMARLWPVTEKLVGSVILPFVNSVPAVGWAILGVVWFGVGNFAVVFVVTLILIPFSMVNLWEGMRGLDPGLLEMGRSFTRSAAKVLWRIQLPLLVPYALAALKLSFSVGWKVALIAEFFGAEAGLGLVMNRARQNFDTATVFAAIVVVIIIVSVVERLILDRVARAWARRSGTMVI